MDRDPSSWREPPWGEELDPASVIAAIPESATMNGLFLSAVVDLARARGVSLESARPSYIGFRPYPLREHATLIAEAARALWPSETLRHGLRKLGRGAPGTLVKSMLGRVILGSVEGPLEIMRAMAKSYPLQSKPGSLTVSHAEPGRCVVEVREIYTFLDSHHVGVFEGAMRFAGVSGRVRIDPLSPTDADLLCEWEAAAGT